MKKLLLLWLLAGPVLAQTPPAASRLPNVLLVVGDDHDLSAIGCYGNRQVKTPHLDALAREGVRFTRAYATTSSCSPSRSTLLAGRHNHNTGQYGLAHATHHFRSHETLKTLPALLHEAGYTTARIGKYHVEPASAYPFDQALSENGSNPVKMAGQCADFLEANRTRPFFLYFCTTDPHRAGNGDNLPYKANPHGNKPGGHEGVTETVYGPDSLKVPFFLPDAPETRAELAQYYQSVSRMDQGIGRLLALLKEKGLWDNTIVIYLSDNGMPVPGAKTTHYEPGVRLPLIVCNPFSTLKGQVCHELVSWVDVAPTILDFAGLNPPVLATAPRPAGGGEFAERGPTSFFHGKSWKPYFEKPAQFKADTLFLSHTFHEVTMYYPMRSVVTKRYKLIHNLAHALPFPFAADLWASSTWQGFMRSGKTQYGPRSRQAYEQRPAFELYDLEKDPQERVNLAKSKAHQAIFNTLLASLKQFQEQTNDPWRVKWRHE
ncbi:sulfatase [Larkinella sp. VNQ87]|uniref:sulfatase family protein n=1 Tax=Larkinella sp. VNQ87 TaxID=3400921 RepID=UPI003C1139B4